ncbi:SspB family protein [Roseiterribacter gracilis]|uniref:Stringent starvation protein B n=1 Tax=Roseiterribacter gracilis TaxID=2812848 RepID=A0A8S8XEP7_9PROT|nr:hypothetical protein TMPK1_33310 [Rhodospirillales bacterium TMPK1]
MSKDYMRYDRMVEDALRGVVRRALNEAAAQGLPGNHHFYLTFRTHAPGVDIPSYLVERYPNEMTIVLQFQFYGLEAAEDHFVVTLSFNNQQERLQIPYAAISVFADPSVNFALQFQAADDDIKELDVEGEEFEPTSSEAPRALPPAAPKPALPPRTDGDGAEVVSLDQFRRK